MTESTGEPELTPEEVEAARDQAALAHLWALLDSPMDECVRCKREREIRARGLCASCYSSEASRGRLAKYPRVRAVRAVLTVVAEAVNDGLLAGKKHTEICAELEMSRTAYHTACSRAREQGLLRTTAEILAEREERETQ